MDARIPIIAGTSVVVGMGTYLWWRREIRRLHRERGYDANDPHLNHEAWLNTKADLRSVTTKGRNVFELARAGILAPVAALIAGLFLWAALPSAHNPALRWDMVGIAAAAALAAFFMGRILLSEWRVFRSRRNR